MAPWPSTKSTASKKKWKNDVVLKFEGVIRQYFILTHNRENVFTSGQVLRDYVHTSVTLISYDRNLVVISVKSCDVIVVTGLERFTKVVAGGGAAGAAAGVVGGGGAGAGIGAAIGMI